MAYADRLRIVNLSESIHIAIGSAWVHTTMYKRAVVHVSVLDFDDGHSWIDVN
jgi:hypothetical protein